MTFDKFLSEVVYGYAMSRGTKDYPTDPLMWIAPSDHLLHKAQDAVMPHTQSLLDLFSIKMYFASQRILPSSYGWGIGGALFEDPGSVIILGEGPFVVGSATLVSSMKIPPRKRISMSLKDVRQLREVRKVPQGALVAFPYPAPIDTKDIANWYSGHIYGPAFPCEVST
jgi:hypothetical protein